MARQEEKFQIFFEPEKGQNSNEHAAFIQKAQDLYRQFLQAKTEQKAIEASEQLTHHIQQYHDQKPSHFVNEFRHAFEALLEHLKLEREQRFLSDAMLEEKRKEVEAVFSERKAEEKEERKHLYESYARADQREREKIEKDAQSPLPIKTGQKSVEPFTLSSIPHEKVEMLNKMLDNLGDTLEDFWEDLGLETEEQKAQVGSECMGQIANDAARYVPEAEELFIGPLSKEVSENVAQLEIGLTKLYRIGCPEGQNENPEERVGLKEQVMMKLCEVSAIETQEQWAKVCTHALEKVSEGYCPPSPTLSH